jgi:hypothetical protein
MVDCVRIGLSKTGNPLVLSYHRNERILQPHPFASERNDLLKFALIEHRHLGLTTPAPEHLHASSLMRPRACSRERFQGTGNESLY